jgi:predicted aconitase with swiveling domain
MGWGGIDVHTGIVLEKGHPLEGMCLKDTVLILDGSKGSNGWSLFFHAAQVSGFGPAALVFPRLDSRTAVTAAVLNVPLVTGVDPAIFDLVRVGDRVLVDGDIGFVEILSRKERP